MKKVQLREDRISDMTRLDDDRKRTVHKIVYSIKDLDRFAGFDGVVRLKPVSEESTKPPEDGLRIGLRNQTDSTKDDLSKLSKKEKEREKRDRETLGEAKVGSLPKTEKNLSSLSSKSHDIENASLGEAKASLGAKDEGPRAGKIVRPTSDKKSNPTDLEQVRIIAPDGYMTKISLSDNPNKYVDHLFPCGEIAEFQHWKAKDLIERGIAEPVEAPT